MCETTEKQNLTSVITAYIRTMWVIKSMFIHDKDLREQEESRSFLQVFSDENIFSSEDDYYSEKDDVGDTLKDTSYYVIALHSTGFSFVCCYTVSHIVQSVFVVGMLHKCANDAAAKRRKNP